MSQAHRPTWNPTQGRETKSGSQQIAKLSLAAHTKLKFRQPGQVSKGDVQARDLRAELAAAERSAEDKKRKAKGLPPLPPPVGALRIEAGAGASADEGAVAGKDGDGEEEESRKRRKMLQEALEADKDDDDDDESDEEGAGAGAGQSNGQAQDKGKGRAVDDDDDDESEEDSDDDSDDEDETAALMAELAKIKQERAEEKARLDAEAASKNAATRDEEIASGNPLLNLQAALGATPATSAPGTPASSAGGAGGFTVKRRWDDDLIFKNQSAGEAAGGQAGKGEFVNDLLRSDFHRKFMHKFIK